MRRVRDFIESAITRFGVLPVYSFGFAVVGCIIAYLLRAPASIYVSFIAISAVGIFMQLNEQTKMAVTLTTRRFDVGSSVLRLVQTARAAEDLREEGEVLARGDFPARNIAEYQRLKGSLDEARGDLWMVGSLKSIAAFDLLYSALLIYYGKKVRGTFTDQDERDFVNTLYAFINSLRVDLGMNLLSGGYRIVFAMPNEPAREPK